MAADDDDPDVKAGRAITSRKQASPAAAPAAVDDPDVAAGRAITATTPPLQVSSLDPGGQASYSPDWTWRGVARNAAAGLTDVGAGVLNVASDPYANLVGRPLLTVGQTAYDFLAPML